MFKTNVLFHCFERVLTGNNIREVNNNTLEGLQYSAMDMWVFKISARFRAVVLLLHKFHDMYYSKCLAISTHFVLFVQMKLFPIFWQFKAFQASVCIELHDHRQEPITRSVQLPHIPVMAFSQIDLFLIWIYCEFRPPQESQWTITSTKLIFIAGRSDGLLMVSNWAIFP